MGASRVSAGDLLSTRLLFLCALTVLAVAYTVVAFGMEWRVERGQIGPGFFPRLVGGAAVIGCLVAIVRAMRGRRLSPDSPVDEEGQPEQTADGGTDAWAPAATVGCMALLFLLFEPLGALLSSVLFLGGVLTFVNRGHRVVNAVLSVGVSLGLYLLFEVLLDVGLPEGFVSF